MNIVTVIPARGGSKSIKLKNIQELNGKPLLQYSVEYSLKCPLISKTIVSTDSELIAEVARKAGAEVPFIRPSELAEDLTQDFPVLRHALEELEEQYGKVIDVIVLLRPTSPLRPAGLIERAIGLLVKYPDATSVRAVVPASEHPYRVWKKDGNFITGFIESVPESYNLPRQLLPEAYFQSGDIEVVRRSTLLSGSVSGEKVLPLILDFDQMVDIDDPADLLEAEKKARNES